MQVDQQQIVRDHEVHKVYLGKLNKIFGRNKSTQMDILEEEDLQMEPVRQATTVTAVGGQPNHIFTKQNIVQKQCDLSI